MSRWGRQSHRLFGPILSNDLNIAGNWAMARTRTLPALDPATAKSLADGVLCRGPGQYRARKLVNGQRITKTFTTVRLVARGCPWSRRSPRITSPPSCFRPHCAVFTSLAMPTRPERPRWRPNPAFLAPATALLGGYLDGFAASATFFERL